MKKTFFALVCLVFVVAMSSCSKTNTCTCVTHATIDGEPMGEDITATATVEGDCSDNNSSVTQGGILMTVTCK